MTNQATAESQFVKYHWSFVSANKNCLSVSAKATTYARISNFLLNPIFDEGSTTKKKNRITKCNKFSQMIIQKILI